MRISVNPPDTETILESALKLVIKKWVTDSNCMSEREDSDTFFLKFTLTSGGIASVVGLDFISEMGAVTQCDAQFGSLIGQS